MEGPRRVIGDSLGPYRIEQELGSGGMGTVYRASVGDGVVALKVVHPHLLETDDAVARFRREVEIGKRVRHPNVVATLDAGEAGGRHYLAMEHVEGQTLQSLLAELERVPEELCRHVGREVARGLAAIHAAGAIHRDVKPENVLITPDHVVKVMDLGVARMADEALRLSQTGAFVGSLRYAAPECFSSELGPPDHRADLHALGLVLYELATGDAPYAALDLHGSIRHVLEKIPRRLGEANPQLSPYFEEVVHTLLVKDPRGRFASADDLLRVLEVGEDGEWWSARSTALRVATKRPLRRIRIPRETDVYGRDDELAVLRERYDRAAAGHGQVVLVAGEAGIGKSRVVDELVTRLHAAGEDVNFLFGSYPPGGAATAAGAWSTAYREHFGVGGSAAFLPDNQALVPAFDALLRGDASPEGAAPLTRASLQTCFVHATQALAAERPTIVLIDDLHFAPDEGRALFSALAVAVPGQRVMLIGTSRPGISETWQATVTRHDHTTQVALERLGPKDLVRLLSDALRSPDVAARLAGQIGLRSDGNPFFVFEIVRGLREGQFITQTEDGSWVTTKNFEEILIPSSVLDLVNARVAELDEDERDLVDVAACCGFEFDPSLVAEALGMPVLPTLKRFAQIERRHRLVRSAGRLMSFDHHQIQESLHEGLMEQLREHYHAAIADALIARSGAGVDDAVRVDPELCVELCDHLVRGARVRDALPHLARALTHLEQGYVHGRAAALVERVLDAPGVLEGARRSWALVRLAGYYEIQGRAEPQHAACVEAITAGERDGADREVVNAELALGKVLRRTGRYDDAEAAMRRAGERARNAGFPTLEAAAVTNRGALCFGRGKLAEAHELLEHGRELARSAEHAYYEVIAAMNLGMVLATERDLDAAQECFEYALAFYRERGDRRSEGVAIGSLGNVWRMRGNVAAAREHDERFLAIAREIGDRAGEQTATNNVGTSYLAEDRLVEARRYMERAVVLAEELSDPQDEASAKGYLGEIWALEGRTAEAYALFENAVAICREVGAHQNEATALADLGALLLELDRPEEARTHLRASRELAEEYGYSHLLPQLARLLGAVRVVDGDADAARAEFDDALRLAADVGGHVDTVLTRCHLACLPGGDADAALAALEGQADHLTPVGRRHAYLLLWRATGDRAHLDEAQRLLDEALAKVPETMHAAMLENVRVNRDIAAASAPAS